MRIVMMGTGSFAEPTFDVLLQSSHRVVGLVTQPDRPTGKERGSTRQPKLGLKEMALERGIPVLQPEKINTPEGVQSLIQWQPDLFVVAAYGQILSREVLTAARFGGINVHASLLPKYRGAAPIAWAIYHGEAHTGVSIFKMSVLLDAGDIVAQENVPIGPDETAGEVEARLGPLGARLALAVVDRMAVGPVSGLPQDKTLVTKAPKLAKEHGLLDWNRSAQQVCNQVRAMQPWPTAYTFLHEPDRPPMRLIINRAGLFQGKSRGSVRPGKVILASEFPRSFLISAGAIGSEECGVVEIKELQPAGKRRMSAEDFLRGHPLTEETYLGPE